MSFKPFLVELLKRASLTSKEIEAITNNTKYYNLFQQAFVHKSYNADARANYEKMEMMGDLVVNMVAVNYALKKYPEIQSAHWMSNIKHRIVSGKNFALLASSVGFYQHIKISKELKEIIDEKLKRYKGKKAIAEIKDYQALLEDVFEAFCGTLQFIINERTEMIAGPGYAVCYAFVSSFLDKIEIPRNVEDVFDPISLVKEIYDNFNQQGYNWPSTNDRMTVWRRNTSNGEFETTYYVQYDKLPQEMQKKVGYKNLKINVDYKIPKQCKECDRVYRPIAHEMNKIVDKLKGNEDEISELKNLINHLEAEETTETRREYQKVVLLGSGMSN